MVTRDNYEAYLLDYLEGELSVELVAELVVFLEANPDLKEDLDTEMLPHLKPDAKESTLDKSSLKRTITEVGGITATNYEDFFLQEFEGQLNDAEQAALQTFLAANPDLEKERAYYQRTRLQPDVNEGYDQKELLEHHIVATANVTDENFEDTFIAGFEGLLNPSQQRELLTFIQLNPGLERNRDLLKLSFLKADTALVHPNKGELKKTAVLPLWQNQRVWWAAAASVAVLLMGYSQFNSDISGVYEPIGQVAGISQTFESDGEKWVRSFASIGARNTILPTTSTIDFGRPVVKESFAFTSSVNSADDGGEENDPARVEFAAMPLQNNVQLPGARAVQEWLTDQMPETGTQNDVVMAMQAAQSARPKQTDEPYSIKEFASKMFREKVLGKEDKEQTKRNLDALDIYEAGVLGVNKVFKADLEMQKGEDTQKKTTVLTFKSPWFSIRKRLRKLL